LERWRAWWHSLSPVDQDRIVGLGPLVSILLFLAVILTALTYFTVDESNREYESMVRDVEYAQQRLRLRLIERQEQLLRVARDLSSRETDGSEFLAQAQALSSQYPELQAVTWLNARGEVVSAYASPAAPESMHRPPGMALPAEALGGQFDQLRDVRHPLFSANLQQTELGSHFFLLIPMREQRRFNGALLAEFSVDGLLRHGIPTEVMARHAIALLDDKGQVIAGSQYTPDTSGLLRMPWSAQHQTYQLAIDPLGQTLFMRAVSYRASRDNMGEAFFWVVGALSVLTVWMLLANMRHSRRRLQVQRALLLETNFRRAMENSMLTGMRVLDMQGRITYVNPAFCTMTGWTEADLLGTTAPFPYWPESEIDNLAARLEDELKGRSTPGGFEVLVKRKNGSVFSARMYVSPLVDGLGEQTGWMTSMTDITEPKRIREELRASYERFTTVLDSLDEAISVAPLSSSELLFANRMYQTWFGPSAQGHQHLVDLSSSLPNHAPYESPDTIDVLAGLPTDALLQASIDNVVVFIDELSKWLEIRTRYLTWVDGRLTQMVIATDVTARKQAEAQAALQQTRAEIASRLITMGEMASSVAHELNQPLTAISNYSSGMITRLQKKQINEEELLSALEKTARQAQRAGQIIQRIRAFVKRSEPNRTPSDVAQMVSNATELADIELRRHLTRLSTYVAARLPKVMADPILIEQVLINLLKNAGESIAQAQRPPGQRRVELCVTPKLIDGIEAIEFMVRDTGSGIPADQLESIFEAFYSTKTEGMGIGLKLCRSIVESHHGRLRARNLYNGAEVAGCEFSFWIPLTPSVNR